MLSDKQIDEVLGEIIESVEKHGAHGSAIKLQRIKSQIVEVRRYWKDRITVACGTTIDFGPVRSERPKNAAPTLEEYIYSLREDKPSPLPLITKLGFLRPEIVAILAEFGKNIDTESNESLANDLIRLATMAYNAGAAANAAIRKPEEQR